LEDDGSRAATTSDCEVIVMMGWNLDAGAWLGMSFGMVLWFALAVVAAWLVVRGLMALERSRTDGTSAPRPEEILRERFARGDIDADEFERRLTVLHSN
jgi:putative membrane protein